MNRPAGKRARLLLVVVFAVGMAWVEAASVHYLRAMVDRKAFNWPVFCVALLLMATPVAQMGRRMWSRR